MTWPDKAKMSIRAKWSLTFSCVGGIVEKGDKWNTKVQVLSLVQL